MKPANCVWTTATPGVVDLPTPRRSSKEVALEKKRKVDALAAKAEAKRLAVARVAEVKSQVTKGQNKGTGTNRPGPKQTKKRPAMSASREVSFFPITDRITWHLLKPCTLDTGDLPRPHAQHYSSKEYTWYLWKKEEGR